MKKGIFYFTALSLLMAFGISSCDLVKDLLDINFKTGYKEVPFTVTPRSAGEYILVEHHLQSDLKQDIEDNGGDISNLNNVEVSKGQVEVVSAGMTLDPFEWVEVYLSTPNISEKLVAHASVIDDGTTLVDLNVDPISLNDILAEEEYKVVVKGNLDQDLKESIDMVVRLMYEVTVSP